MEIWKTIKQAPAYEVSNLGRVRKTLIRSAWKRDGYDRINLRVNGQYKNFSVHRMVAEAFIGDSPLMVNHKNGNRADNRVENLEYVTNAQNVFHAINVLGSKFGKKRRAC